jgi:hypothetical protein
VVAGTGDPPTTEWAAAMQGFSRGAHRFGCTALLIGALLSLAGQRMGNAVVRGTSWVMIGVLGWVVLMAWRHAGPELTAEFGSGMVVPLMLVLTAFMLGPWLPYLFLFRKSKYP